MPRVRAWMFSSARPGQRKLLDVHPDHVLDRLDAVVRPDPPREVGRVVLRVPRRVLRRHRDAVDVVAAQSVGRQRRADRRVDAAGEPERHRREAVLVHVVPQPDDQRRPHLGLVRKRLADHRLGGRLVGRQWFRTQHPAPDVQAFELTVAGVPARGEVHVQHEQVLDELRRACQHRAVRADDERVAVEHEVVLAADLVGVDQRRARFGRAARDERQPLLVLRPLVRRRVRRHHEVDAGAAQRRDRAAVLPDVLADDHADVEPVEPDDVELGARLEPAVLVEHAVVREVVLELPRDDLAAVERRRRVARADLVEVEVTDVGQHFTAAGLVEAARQRLDALPGSGGEGLAQRKVLDGITGQGHLGEDDDVGAGFGGPAGPGDVQVGVAVEVTDGGVDLGERDAQLRHAAILAHGHRLSRANVGEMPRRVRAARVGCRWPDEPDRGDIRDAPPPRSQDRRTRSHRRSATAR